MYQQGGTMPTCDGCQQLGASDSTQSSPLTRKQRQEQNISAGLIQSSQHQEALETVKVTKYKPMNVPCVVLSL
jgi:hypothetical protein